MTEVALRRGPTNLASPASRGPSSSSPRYLANADSDLLQRGSSGESHHTGSAAGGRRLQGLGERELQGSEEEERWSFLALLLELLRKSFLGCKEEGGGCGMEIGWPTEVQHVAHVTFDRFHGFLGLPVEFEPEVPRRAPSARGNSVPTILLMMQRRLYEQGGLRAEGIFRINAENSQEELVRDRLNRGIVPYGIDVHCLAGLIKAWFRELPSGVLDPIPPEQVMQCQSEEDCARVTKCLPLTEAALLDWAVNLMADVVQEEQINKMNARNIAMVFAPNMTQMADPLTALMYAVQVMNFLKMLIQKTLKDREDSNLEDGPLPQKDPSDENGHHNPCLPVDSHHEEGSRRPSFFSEEPLLNSPGHRTEDKPNETNLAGGDSAPSGQTENALTNIEGSSSWSQPLPAASFTPDAFCATTLNSLQGKGSRSLNSRRTRKGKGQSGTPAVDPADKKSRGASIVSRLNSTVERIEAWR
ncbi:unnamed protein product [Alopecurus aequalis]